MPVVTVVVPMGRLDQIERQRIAAGITTIVTDETSAPETTVHVIFQAYPRGAAWTASRPSAPVFVQAEVRPDSPPCTRRRLLSRIHQLLSEVLCGSVPEVLVSIIERPLESDWNSALPSDGG